MARKDLISLADRTTKEQQEIARAGGKKSGEARRAKRDLKERLKLGLEIFTEMKAKALKAEGDIEKANVVKELGIETFILLNIANSSLDEKSKLSAVNAIMDRTEGKPVQKSILDANINESRELSDKEKDLINRQIKKEAKKLKGE